MSRITANKTIIPREIDKTSPYYIWAKIQGYSRMNGLGREELAKITGLSKATISNYNSNPTNLGYETVHKFCRYCHINSISELENF